MQHHQLPSLRIRQRAEHGSIDEAENGGIGADSQGQCDHRGGGESGVLAEDADTVTNILKESFDHTAAVRVPAFFLGGLDASHREHGLPPRLFRRHTLGDFLLRQAVDVVAQFGVKILLHLLPSE